MTDQPAHPHLSQVVVRDRFAFVSGHVPLGADGTVLVDDAAGQARAVLEALARTLAGVGFTMAEVTSTTVYLTSTADFAAVNAVFKEFFPETPPARTTVQVGLMHPDIKVEIDAIAYRTAGADDGH
jgi:reactive intermediate/imine deaminase